MYTVLFDVSILATETRVRGMGRYVAELARQLGPAAAAHDVRLRFLVGMDLRRGPLISDDAGAIDELLAKPEIERPRWGYPFRLGAAWAAARATADVMHIPHSGATPLFRMRAKQLITCHDLIPLKFPEHYNEWQTGFGLGRKILDRRRARRADHIIAISQSTADDLHTLLDVPKNKISVVMHGLDHAVWSPEPRQEADYLLYVGDADWRKNHRAMFDALVASGCDVTLLWAGRLVGERLRRVQDDIAATGARVRLLGYVDDEALKTLYRNALGTLFISHAEGFGYPVLEAMALGCPVIAADATSIPEVAGDAATLVDPDDEAAIAQAIGALVGDAALRQRMRDKGIARAATFTRRRQAEQTVAIYLELRSI